MWCESLRGEFVRLRERAQRDYTRIGTARPNDRQLRQQVASLQSSNNELKFESYVTYWHETYGLDVYITEYADQNFSGGAQASMSEIWTFMEAATAFVNQNSWIKAHCWFGAMEDLTNVNPDNSLMNSDGTAPNDLGYFFIYN